MPDGPSRFAYVANSPLMYTDPTGEKIKERAIGLILKPVQQGARRALDFGAKKAKEFYNFCARIITGAPKPASTVDDLIKGSKPGKSTKGRSTLRNRDGGLKQANKDFDGLAPANVRNIPGGRTGNLPGGGKVNVRNNSSGGKPTLEIQKGKNRLRDIRW